MESVNPASSDNTKKLLQRLNDPEQYFIVKPGENRRMTLEEIRTEQKDFLKTVAQTNHFSHCIREIVEEGETLGYRLNQDHYSFMTGLKLTPDEVAEALFETEHDRQRYKVSTIKKYAEVHIKLRKGIKPITD